MITNINKFQKELKIKFKKKSLLIKAFCQDLIKNIKEESYLNKINTLIDKWVLSYVN